MAEERMRLYDGWMATHDDPPTLDEIAELWDLSEGSARCYVERMRTTYGYNIVLRQRKDKRIGELRQKLPKIIATIVHRHKIFPSLSELAVVTGVSRQRIEQVVKQDGLPYRDGSYTIDWREYGEV